MEGLIDVTLADTFEVFHSPRETESIRLQMAAE